MEINIFKAQIQNSFFGLFHNLYLIISQMDLIFLLLHFIIHICLMILLGNVKYHFFVKMKILELNSLISTIINFTKRVYFIESANFFIILNF
jgi:hypothetical protein